MTARRISVALLACAALLMAAGCGGNGRQVVGDEAEDSLYQQALDLKNQGRNGEALSTFLKVIDRRGNNSAPESHLEAGLLYLNYTKDPVEAYHHFKKYLELEPNSKQAQFVRGMLDTAKREFARTLPGRPLEDQSVRLETNDQLDQLRRENQELRAELQALRGGAAPFARAPRTITAPEERTPPMIALDAPASAAPASPPVIPIQEHGAATDSPFTRSWNQPQPVARPAPTAPATAAATPPSRPAAGTRATPTPPASTARRTHTVAPREGLWTIARRYYGAAANQAKVTAIYEANRDVMSSPTDLKPGMVLKIP